MPPKNQKEKESPAPETSVTLKQTTPIPEYKKTIIQMKNDPELGPMMNQEGYSKVSMVLLYKILKILEERVGV